MGLPLWGRWHGVAVTEEGGTISPILGSNSEFLLPSPAPFGGTLPKGEGFLYFTGSPDTASLHPQQ